MRYVTARLGLAAALLVGAGHPAVAATITYSDLASFQAASTTTNIDFSGLAPAGSYVQIPGAVLTVSGVTFAHPYSIEPWLSLFGSQLYVVDDTYTCCHLPSSLAPATLLDNLSDQGASFIITLPSPVTALAFDAASGLGDGTGAPNCGHINVFL